MKKRFIAGATCPACGLVDKIYVLKEDGQETMHCSQCDYLEHKVEDKKDEDANSVVGQWSPVRLPEK